jgi:hypothetical protein
MDWDFCEVHGFFSGAICSNCEACLSNMIKYPMTYRFTSNLTSSAPISLGRWEERTEYDRDFLASMGISVE